MADPKHNLTALLIGTGEFSFSENAVSAADARAKGYLDFGNIVAFTPNAEFKKEEHYGSYRGLRRRDKNVVTEAKLEYKLKSDEWNHNNLRILFGASAAAGFTQPAYAAQAIDAIAFAAAPANSGTQKWFEITVGGARVRNITALVLTGKVAGTDYELDPVLGRVRFLVDQTANIAGNVTAGVITAGTSNSFIGLKPLDEAIKTGFGRLVCFDQNNKNKVVYDHVDFSCEITMESVGEVDGQKYNEVTMSVLVTDTVGTILVRNDNAN